MSKPKTTSISALEDHLGYWLRLVSNNVSGAFGRKLAACGVSVAEWVALRLILRDAPAAPSRLAEAMGMTRGAISKIAERLLKRGLVERLPDERDGRAHGLRLTPAGLKLTAALAKLADANDREYFDCLSQTEQERLRALLAKVANAHRWSEAPTE